ncbi:MAG: NtaA/DmoA family FMN-dependent monooxygenase [Thalassobaculaceae bacterium]|nr:NtaA/DmoA family FMN-dependent monooxygenase [Thalassobaculaceae bacterium]
MTPRRSLCIGLSLTPTWMRGRNDAQARDASETLTFYADLAKTAEAAKLDFVFKPDTLSLNPAMVGKGPGFIGLDPTIMLSAIARETCRIGLVTTASTTFNVPYVIARQLQSLHWASNGRAGWNIVTSIEGAENFGAESMPTAEERYRKAAEFTEVVRALWSSYRRDGTEVIDHAGEFFSVKGPLNVPDHPCGPPPLFQAGASETGREFAATVADAIFAATPDMTAGIDLRSDLMTRTQRLGRPANAVRVLPGLHFFLAKTRQEARDLHRDAHAFLSREKRLASFQSLTGTDIGHLAPGQRLTNDMLPAPNEPVRSRTHTDLLRRFIERETPTVEDVLNRPEVVGSAHWVSVGTAEDVVDDITTWYGAGAMDGFIALPGGSDESMALFFSDVMPMLVEKGLFRREYAGNTLRAHLGQA